MDKDTFDETWPADSEGRTFADSEALEDLKSPSTRSSIKSLAWGILGFILVAWMISSDDPKVRTALLLFVIGLVFNKVSETAQEIRKLRRDVELLKGSVRENRYLVERRF